MELPIVTPPVITLTYASVLGLVFVVMSYAVVRQRVRAKILLGFGEDMALAAPYRAHANFAAYVPLTLIVIGLLEMAGADDLLLRLLGGGLVVARLLHAWGLYMSPGTSPGRFLGTLLTWIVLTIASGSGLYVTLG